jgi:hypothetical protein
MKNLLYDGVYVLKAIFVRLKLNLAVTFNLMGGRVYYLSAS